MANRTDNPWTSKSALAGAAIGSAAIAAALLFASRRRERAGKSGTVYLPPYPHVAPETD